VVVQLVRIPACHAGGRGFEPRPLRQTKKGPRDRAFFHFRFPQVIHCGGPFPITMRIPTYIQRSRHGIYFFRMVVPKAVRGKLDGQGEIKRSLGTRSLREAMRMARPLALQSLDLFASLGGRMSPNPPSIDDLLAKAQSGDLRELKSTQRVTLPNGIEHSYTVEADSTDPAELAAFKELEEKKQAELAAIVQTYHANHPKQELSAEAKAYLRHQDEDLASFVMALPKTKPVAETPKPKPSRRPQNNLLSLRWLEYVSQATGAQWTVTRTVKANQRMFGHFQAWLGADIDITAINRETINRLIDHLRSERIVEAGKRKGQIGLDQRTIDSYTSVINKFLSWAQNKGYFPDDQRLPTALQTLVSKKARRARAERANPPYTLNQLQKLFDPEAFDPKLPHHFWPPLISLFTGARRREIAQLLLSDLFIEDGIHGISINILEDDDKSVKSVAGIRTIPVHPILIELGLLDYVEDVRALNIGPELFPGIGITVDGEKGNAVGNAWGRHVGKILGSEFRNPTFHSFRSTALQVLKKNKVGIEMRCQLAGHEFNHVSQVYAPDRYTLKELMEEGIPKLKYEGLDLSGLKYVRGEFDHHNRKSTVRRVRREKMILRREERKNGK
jgi:integrase